ncbi:hypothetical protein E2C01_054834 [Portunus trituberculatus]|uniref:Uncharacterized protein n=1 Tax=Portunus trituberculatus TaxID=210409 RepID=A0A5B7GT03_PORTR|nr:hypothetical protein [Portunus trituberculatus]
MCLQSRVISGSGAARQLALHSSVGRGRPGWKQLGTRQGPRYSILLLLFLPVSLRYSSKLVLQIVLPALICAVLVKRDQDEAGGSADLVDSLSRPGRDPIKPGQAGSSLASRLVNMYLASLLQLAGRPVSSPRPPSPPRRPAAHVPRGVW